MDQIAELPTEITPPELLDEEQLRGDLDPSGPDDIGDIEYRPMPAQQVWKKKVKVRVVGPGQPMRYPLTDEE